MTFKSNLSDEREPEGKLKTDAIHSRPSLITVTFQHKQDTMRKMMVMVAPKITTGSESTSGKNNVSLLEDSEWMAQDDDLLSTLSFSIPSVSLTDSQVSLLVSIPGFY